MVNIDKKENLWFLRLSTISYHDCTGYRSLLYLLRYSYSNHFFLDDNSPTFVDFQGDEPVKFEDEILKSF